MVDRLCHYKESESKCQKGIQSVSGATSSSATAEKEGDDLDWDKWFENVEELLRVNLT